MNILSRLIGSHLARCKESRQKCWVAACIDGEAPKLAKLIRQGVDIDALHPFQYDEASGLTAAMLCCVEGRPDVLKLLIESGCDIEARDQAGWCRTPLMLASHGDGTGQSECVRLLIQAGADIEARDANGMTPAIIACKAWAFATLHMLADAGADIDAVAFNGHYCSMHAGLASTAGRPEFLDFMVERACALLAAKPAYRTYVGHTAAALGRVDILRRLLDAGWEPDQRGIHGDTAAMSAAAHGQPDSLRALVEAGCDLAATDRGGHTASQLGAKAGHPELVASIVSGMERRSLLLDTPGAPASARPTPRL